MRYATILLVFLVLASVSAHGNETFDEAKHLIDEQVPCESLTEDQLATIGDYAMELMHPGEAHEQMDLMMGGEGSESLYAAHVRMGLSYYCGQSDFRRSGMMGPGMGYQDGMMGNTWIGSPGMMGYGWDHHTRAAPAGPGLVWGSVIVVLIGTILFLLLR